MRQDVVLAREANVILRKMPTGYTTHPFLPASARDLDLLLAEVLHFDRGMVGLLPVMILALGATAMAVLTGAMAPALVLIGTALGSS